MGPRQNDTIGRKKISKKKEVKKFQYIYDSHGGKAYVSYSPYKLLGTVGEKHKH